MKIGFSTWGMPVLPIDAALEHLAGLGFDGVEIAVIPGFTTELDKLNAAERRRIRRLLDQHHLDLPSIAGHQSVLAREDAAHAEHWRRLTGTVDLCVDWSGENGPPVLASVLITGEVSMQVHRRPNYDPLAAAELTYRTLENAFREAGITRGG